MTEIVVTVDDATLVGQRLDALEHDPNVRRQPRDLFDVYAGAPATASDVHTPGRLGSSRSVACRRPTTSTSQSGTRLSKLG